MIPASASPAADARLSRLSLPRHSLALAENQGSGDLRRMKKLSDTDSPLLFSDPLYGSSDHTCPDFLIENYFHDQGYATIAGVDEVGRGPLAGPVVAASVILDQNNIPDGLNDSKKLTPRRREELFDQILRTSRICVSSIPAATIDRINIRQASLLAMKNSCLGLELPVDVLLVDGRDCPHGLKCRTLAIIKGDGRALSIAAASIVAKVVRDRQMVYAAQLFPAYGFDRHKGYGSKYHIAAIEKHGPCPLHRLSFSPLREKPR